MAEKPTAEEPVDQAPAAEKPATTPPAEKPGAAEPTPVPDKPVAEKPSAPPAAKTTTKAATSAPEPVVYVATVSSTDPDVPLDLSAVNPPTGG
ncbi:hypothetical protein ACU686_26325 [Yinghuangia aomiensis]